MNPPLKKINLPNPPSVQQGQGFSQLRDQVATLAKWAQDITIHLQTNVLTPMQQQINSAANDIGTAASASSITLPARITHITGTVTITNITAPAGFSGIAWLIADGAFQVGTGGNIAAARGPYTVGQAVKILFDPSANNGAGVWYPE